MNRRGFLGMIGGLLAAEAIPFGRVWSFPSKIVIPEVSPELEVGLENLSTIYYDRKALDVLSRNFIFEAVNTLKNMPMAPRSKFVGVVHPYVARELLREQRKRIFNYA